VLVEGFADSTGTAAHNQELSEHRAGAVRTALVNLGIGGERVGVRGYGESHPVAANDTAEHRQLNRRVEIVLSDEDGKVIAR
jgi:outer membrane protein OmpA-like peptidoglycan-associated protein